MINKRFILDAEIDAEGDVMYCYYDCKTAKSYNFDEEGYERKFLDDINDIVVGLQIDIRKLMSENRKLRSELRDAQNFRRKVFDTIEEEIEEYCSLNQREMSCYDGLSAIRKIKRRIKE